MHFMSAVYVYVICLYLHIEWNIYIKRLITRYLKSMSLSLIAKLSRQYIECEKKKKKKVELQSLKFVSLYPFPELHSK